MLENDDGRISVRREGNKIILFVSNGLEGQSIALSVKESRQIIAMIKKAILMQKNGYVE